MSQVNSTMTGGLIAELGDRLLQAPVAESHMKRGLSGCLRALWRVFWLEEFVFFFF